MLKLLFAYTIVRLHGVFILTHGDLLKQKFQMDAGRDSDQQVALL